MSKLKSTIEELKFFETAGVSMDTATIVLNIRLSPINISGLDHLAERFGQSRVQMGKILIQDAIVDCLDSLGVDSKKRLEIFVNDLKGEK
jgi:hypothetical protein